MMLEKIESTRMEPSGGYKFLSGESYVPSDIILIVILHYIWLYLHIYKAHIFVVLFWKLV